MLVMKEDTGNHWDMTTDAASSEVWSASGYAYIQRDDGLILHRQWIGLQTGRKEWRRVPTIVPAEDETVI